MQVVPSAPLAAAVFAKSVAQKNTIAFSAQGLLRYIAGSTHLSATDKKSFIATLADIEKYANGDPKLLMELMAAVMLAESANQEKNDPRMSEEDAEALYHQDYGDTDSITTALADTDEVQPGYSVLA